MTWDGDAHTHIHAPVGRVLHAIALYAEERWLLIDISPEGEERVARLSATDRQGSLQFRLRRSPSSGTDLTLEARGAWPSLEGWDHRPLSPWEIELTLRVLVNHIVLLTAAHRPPLSQ